MEDADFDLHVKALHPHLMMTKNLGAVPARNIRQGIWAEAQSF